MELETPTKTLHIGGFGCKMCRFWQKHSKQQAELLRLTGDNWGRCFNNENISDCLTSEDAFRESSKDRSNVDIERLCEDTVIMSTTENYGCKRFRGKKEVR